MLRRNNKTDDDGSKRSYLAAVRAKKKPPESSGGFFINALASAKASDQIFLIFSSILKIDLLEPMKRRL